MKFFHIRALCVAVLTLAPMGGTALANTLCVNPNGSQGCYSTIQAAVNAASNYDVINVAPGTYKEDVVIGKPLSLVGGGNNTVIDATGLANGIFVDGYDHSGLGNVVIDSFMVQNAQYEGVLVVSASNVTIRNNTIQNNDKIGPVFGSGVACAGEPAFETDESGDCGGGLHLLGVSYSTISDNVITGNASGLLVSDETAESFGNLIIHNSSTDNPPQCGIVLASHPPVGSSPPYYAAHYGVDNNTVSQNVSSRNGVTVGGAGVGLFSDGEGPGKVTANVITGNEITDNGIPGVSVHSHVGPAFGAPADNFTGNMIIGNRLSGNGPDTGDTATPGSAGILVSSGGGGSPINGLIISQNEISNEQIAVAISTPAQVNVHLNTLLGTVGVQDVCAYEGGVCTGSIDATENFFGCSAGPSSGGCGTVNGADIRFTPWLLNAPQQLAGVP